MSEKNRNPSKARSRVLDAALVGLFVALMTVGAYLKIPGPIVPFTLQTFFVTMCGILLGARRGVIAQVVYIILGLIGIPVFAGGGGFGYVVQPTFGYLLGFILCAFITGLACDRMAQSEQGIRFWKLTLFSLLGLLVVYLIGCGYYLLVQTLYFGKEVSIGGVLWSFVVLFLPTDILSTLLAVAVGPRIRKAVQSYS